MILEDRNNIYLIFYYLLVFVREFIIVSMLSVIDETGKFEPFHIAHQPTPIR